MALNTSDLSGSGNYHYYRINNRFNPPLLEGSFVGYRWNVVAVLSTGTQADKISKSIVYHDVASDMCYCKLCLEPLIGSEPELHEGRCLA